MVSRAMTWLWFFPHSGEGVFLVRVFSSPLLKKYIRVVRDFFSDSVVGNFVFGVSCLFLVLLFVSLVETVLYSLFEGFEALVGTVSGWSDVASLLRSVIAVNSMVMSSPCAAVGGRFFKAVLETDLVHAFSFGLWRVCSFSSVLMVWTTGLEADSKRVLSVVGILVTFAGTVFGCFDAWAPGLETDSKRRFSVAGISVSFPEMDEEEGKTSKRKTGVKETCAFHSGLWIPFPQVTGLLLPQLRHFIFDIPSYAVACGAASAAALTAGVLMVSVGVSECVSSLRSVVQLLLAFDTGGVNVVLSLFVFASVGILVDADFGEFPFRKSSLVDIKESVGNGTMGLWVITTSGQADLWGGNNRPHRKSLPGAAAAKLAPRTVAASSQVCVREEGETKVQAKIPVFIQDLTGKRHCVMVEGGWDVHDLTRWAAVACGVIMVS